MTRLWVVVTFCGVHDKPAKTVHLPQHTQGEREVETDRTTSSSVKRGRIKTRRH